MIHKLKALLSIKSYAMSCISEKVEFETSPGLILICKGILIIL